MQKKTAKPTKPKDSQTRAEVVEAIRKKYGAGAIAGKLDEAVEFISSGSLALDEALGGGYARGRIIEVFGQESSGKTTLTLHAIAECQKAGGLAAFVDAEHALDTSYAVRIGVDVTAMELSQPDSAEEALEIADMLVGSRAFAIVVIDSVAALTPQAEIDGEMGDSHVGLQARLMGQALRKLCARAHRANCTVYWVNQMRMKIGGYGNPNVTTGGNSLKFYATQRLSAKFKEKITDRERVVGATHEVTVVKNKVSPPFRTALFDITYGKGIDRFADLRDGAVAAGLFTKSGSWYAFDGQNVAQGVFNLRNKLEDEPEFAKAVAAKLLAAKGLGWAP